MNFLEIHDTLHGLLGVFYPIFLLGLPFLAYVVVKLLIEHESKVDEEDKIDPSKRVLTFKYRGSEKDALKKFQKHSEKLTSKGYNISSQTYVPVNYGCGSFLIALLLCFVLIGILVFIYMLIVKPEGYMSVTYELSESKINELGTKSCPMCAESVKEKALICRFCNHKFI